MGISKGVLPVALGSLVGLAGSAGAREPLVAGNMAPDFSAPASDGTTFRLSEHLGKGPIVLYFYPKDDTPGCTKEACSLRDSFTAFRNVKAEIFGVSYDSVESHRRFIAKHRLPFVLLSDQDRAVARAYGAEGLFVAKRMSYVIGANGRILYVNPAVDPSKHDQELLKVLGAGK
ncbi:MAG TPA: peroxiredoxin [Elusimicrobia bacterium]|nr:peroxiredoxin [Elusimicrobiota bacterium]